MDLSPPSIVQTLHLDVLSKIVSYLPLREACRLRGVCRNWRNCINDHFSAMNILCLNGSVTIKQFPNDDLFRMRHTMNLDVKTIYRNQLNYDYAFVPDEKFAETLARLFPNLTEVYIVGWQQEEEQFAAFCGKLFSSLTGLKKLAIEQFCSDEVMDSIIQNLQSLYTLILLYTRFSLTDERKSFLKKMKKLCLNTGEVTVLDIEGSSSLTAASFLPGWRQERRYEKRNGFHLSRTIFPNLEHVGLPLSDGKSSLTFLTQLLTSQSQISSLELYTTEDKLDSETSESLATLLTQFLFLQSLSFDVSFRCAELLQAVAQRIDHFHALETICLQTTTIPTMNIMFRRLFGRLPTNRMRRNNGRFPKIVLRNSNKLAEDWISYILTRMGPSYKGHLVEAKDKGFFSILDSNRPN